MVQRRRIPLSEIKSLLHPLSGMKKDFDMIVRTIGDAAIVLMGEATHGTQEFYETRMLLSQRLITEKRFTAIGLEADFPDAYRIHQYVNQQGNDQNAHEALAGFKRFPQWMWRNEPMVGFVEWLRAHNTTQPDHLKVAVYGLDLYSLHDSISQIIGILKKIDPAAAAIAQERYNCFANYQNPQEYGYMASQLAHLSCKDQVIAQLIELKKKQLSFYKYDNFNQEQERFYVEQNALVIRNAESYYRSLFAGDQALSWNIRDEHMMETVFAIEAYNKTVGRNHNLIIWAHNSHLGDARATQMSSYGELNLGQLVKEAYGAAAISIGFTTYTGTVSAASRWGGAVERKYVQPALKESMEAFFHTLEVPAFFIILNEHAALYEFFDHDDYLQRAIGVIYLPATERQSHYFYAQLSRQFDIVIHYDTTHALVPLERSSHWENGEDLPETFPSGF